MTSTSTMGLKAIAKKYSQTCPRKQWNARKRKGNSCHQQRCYLPLNNVVWGHFALCMPSYRCMKQLYWSDTTISLSKVYGICIVPNNIKMYNYGKDREQPLRSTFTRVPILHTFVITTYIGVVNANAPTPNCVGIYMQTQALCEQRRKPSIFLGNEGGNSSGKKRVLCIGLM